MTALALAVTATGATAARAAADPIVGTWTRAADSAQIVVTSVSSHFTGTVTKGYPSENGCPHPIGQLVWEDIVKGSSGLYTGINHGFSSDASAGCPDERQSIEITMGRVSGNTRSLVVCNKAGYGCSTWTRPATGGEAAPTSTTSTSAVIGGTSWTATATRFRGHNGTRYAYTCPAGGAVHTVWGTSVYTDDSSVCTAAVHAGRLTLARGGTVTIEMRTGKASYKGTSRNGVTTRSYAKWPGSFVIVGALAPPSSGPAIGGSTWDATAVQYRGRNGSRFMYSCPAGGVVHAVWGTDVYTDDSSVCTAAVHVGLITAANGGTVTIEIRAAESSYTGSTRNGISTTSYGPWHGSFVFVR